MEHLCRRLSEFLRDIASDVVLELPSDIVALGCTHTSDEYVSQSGTLKIATA